MNERNTETVNAVIYARYSSHAQRDVSIEQQIKACRLFADHGGINIVDIYEDRALTGTSDKRPAFQKMIKDSKHADWSYVIVYTLDRFARDRYDSAVYKRQLKNNNVKVLSAMENITDDPTGILLESLLEGMAEYYSKELSRKVSRGMDDNASKCLVNGSLPLGYTRGSDGRYQIVEHEAEVVREIFQRVKAGDSLFEIKDDLNARGIKTKFGNSFKKSSFGLLLTNERYTGMYIYRDVRVPGGIPAIISKELFDEVQAILYQKPNCRKDPTNSTPQKRRRQGGTYLLTGKLFCGKCKSPMIGVSGKSQGAEPYYYYTCKGRRADHSSCNKKNVRRDWVEFYVAQALKETMLTENVIPILADAAIAYQETHSENHNIAALEDQIADVNRSLKNLMAALEAGIFTATTQARMQELEAQQRDLSRLLALAKEQAEQKLTREEIIASLELFCEGDINDKTYQEALIDTFLVAAYVYDDHFRFIFNVGDKTQEHNIPIDIDSVPDDTCISSGLGDHSFLYEQFGALVYIVSGLFVCRKSI